MTIENPSINQIFEKDRKKYIPEVGKQLIQENEEEIEINGERLCVDYRVISIGEKERKDANPVILMTGFGSGWEGIAELGFSLAAEGRKVILLSLPGYGNSEDPGKKYYGTDNFDNEAEAIRKLLEKLPEEKGQKFHLVGHSMGSEILASLAEKNPELVASLVLLAPAGVKDKESLWSLGPRFGLDGVKSTLEYMVRMKFSGETDYQDQLKKYISETKSPFAKDRLAQRMSEVRRLKKGRHLEKLQKINSPYHLYHREIGYGLSAGRATEKNNRRRERGDQDRKKCDGGASAQHDHRPGRNHCGEY